MCLAEPPVHYFLLSNVETSSPQSKHHNTYAWYKHDQLWYWGVAMQTDVVRPSKNLLATVHSILDHYQWSNWRSVTSSYKQHSTVTTTHKTCSRICRKLNRAKIFVVAEEVYEIMSRHRWDIQHGHVSILSYKMGWNSFFGRLLVVFFILFAFVKGISFLSIVSLCFLYLKVFTMI